VQAARAGCLVAVLLAAALPGYPQEPLPEPVVPGATGSSNLADHVEGSTRLPQIARQIPDLIAKKEWDTLAHTMQMLLEAPQGTLLHERLRDAAGRSYVHWRSPAVQVNAVLARLKPEALKVYNDYYGEQGNELLTEARKKNDVRMLAEVAQRHLYTEAGPLALALLATEHLDAGQFLPAALCYERLLHHPRGDPKPAALYEAAVAFRKVGDSANAELAWKRLKDKLGKDGLLIEGRRLTARQVKQELDRVTSLTSSNASDWLLFQGNATRSGRGTGGQPDLTKSLWKRVTLVDRSEDGGEVDKGEEVKPLLERALKARMDDATAPILPGGFPIAVGDKAVYRTYAGVTAIYLTEVKDKQGQLEGKPGDIYWKSTELDGSLGMLFHDPGLRPIVTNWAQTYERAKLAGILFENPMVGGLSADGRYVYTIDDLSLPPPPPQGPRPVKMPTHPKLAPLIAQNSLQAFNLNSGKIEWRLGNSWRKDDPFNGSHWLGAPLPLGGTLYALSETNAGELRLVCIEPTKGKVLSVQPLARVEDRFRGDLRRRTQPVHLAYSDGVLVCPTHAGAVLGVDLGTQSVIWGYTYRQARPPVTAKGLPLLAEPPSWRNTAPVIVDGKVVFNAPDEGSVHCLNLRDGSLVWRSPKDESDLYLAGVQSGKVLVVGKTACRALDLASGKEAWKVDTGIPSGMGVTGGGTYYLPLRSAVESGKAAVCALDVAKGRIVRFIPAGAETPGNLVLHGGQLISQGPLAVTAYSLKKEGRE
jgi:outer membrane protein assembly factor BamB